jgi:hypothetical protein
MTDLPAPEERCTAKLAVYVTENERNMLTELCQAQGYTVSELGRILFRRALKALPKEQT